MTQPTVQMLFDRMATRGTGAYGLSAVNQLEHALQSAALATEEGLGEKMVIAALFHDIGHMFEDEDVDLASQGIDDKHEDSSAEVLYPLFGEEVSTPVRLHVASKRYLCSTDPAYYDLLSEDSKTSLKLQGGLMNADEVARFEANPYYRDGVTLRIIDDKAKVPGLAVPGLDAYREMAGRLVTS